MVRKFPEFSRFSLIFFQKVPFSRFSLSCTNPVIKHFLTNHNKPSNFLLEPSNNIGTKLLKTNQGLPKIVFNTAIEVSDPWTSLVYVNQVEQVSNDRFRGSF